MPPHGGAEDAGGAGPASTATANTEELVVAEEHLVGVTPESCCCNICHDLVTVPVSTPCCPAVYCEECLAQWLVHEPSCPVNKAQHPVEPSQMRHRQDVTAELDALQVRCPHHPSCSWTGSVADLREKHWSTCVDVPQPSAPAAAHSGFQSAAAVMSSSSTKTSSLATASITPGKRFVGLSNQGATCYLNSLLQSLFMTPEFRNAVYRWVPPADLDKPNSHLFQLAKLFVLLQCSDRRAVGTTFLTKSFGWDRNDAFEQHDVQELCRVLFDALELNLKDTEQENLIQQLYQGKMKDYVKCTKCNQTSARHDNFLDVPLVIRPFGSTDCMGSVEEALDKFVEVETLEGNNAYNCERCNDKVKAEKGLKFVSFPYLLTLQLKRFDFNYETGQRIKLNDKVTFPMIVNLDHYIDSEDNEDHPPYNYELFSVMIHAGSALGGHYYAYIKDFETQTWFDFDDSSVSQIPVEDVHRAFGGVAPGQRFASSASAYMLLYRRVEADRNEAFIPAATLPPAMKAILQQSLEDEARERQRREAERNQLHVEVVRFGLDGKKDTKQIKIDRDAPISELKTRAMAEFGLQDVPAEQCALHRFSDYRDQVIRSLVGMEDLTIAESANLSAQRAVYLEYLLEVSMDPRVPPQTYAPNTVFLTVIPLKIDQDVKSLSPRRLAVHETEKVLDLRIKAGRVLEVTPAHVLLVGVGRYNNRPILFDDDDALLSDEGRRTGAERVYLVECRASDVNLRLEQTSVYTQIGKAINTIVINVVFPDSKEVAYKVDQRSKLAQFKKVLAADLQLPENQFLMLVQYTSYRNPLRDTGKTFIDHYLDSGTTIFIEEGNALGLNDFKFELFLFTPVTEGNDYSDAKIFKKIDTSVANTEWTANMFRQMLSNQLHKHGIDIPAERLRVRCKSANEVFPASNDLLRVLSPHIHNEKAFTVEDLGEPEPKVSADHILFSVRQWFPDKYELGPITDMVLEQTCTYDDLLQAVSVRFDISREQLQVIKCTASLYPHLMDRVGLHENNSWKVPLPLEDCIKRPPLWLYRDGGCIYIRDSSVGCKKMTPADVEKIKQEDFAAMQSVYRAGGETYKPAQEKALKIKFVDRQQQPQQQQEDGQQQPQAPPTSPDNMDSGNEDEGFLPPKGVAITATDEGAADL